MSDFCRSAMRCSSVGVPMRRRILRVGAISLPYWFGVWKWLVIPLPPLPPELAIIGATAFAGLLGLIVGALAIRRQGIYFAMITLALAQMMYFFAVQAPFTHGEDGIQAVPRGKLFGLHRSGQSDEYVFHGAGDLPRLLPADLSHHQFAVRRGAQGDPRERAARDLARLQDRALQARRLRAVGDVCRASPARPRRWCSSSPR